MDHGTMGICPDLSVSQAELVARLEESDNGAEEDRTSEVLVQWLVKTAVYISCWIII